MKELFRRLLAWVRPGSAELNAAMDIALELEREKQALVKALMMLNQERKEISNNSVNIVVSLLTVLGGETTVPADVVKAVVTGNGAYRILNNEDGSCTLRIEVAECEGGCK